MDHTTVSVENILPSLVTHAKIAQIDDTVHKQQCFFSFDTPLSPLGLFVNLFSFESYGFRFVKLYFEKTGLRLYLHIKRSIIDHSNNENEDTLSQTAKPTKLGIGIDGGFLLQDNKLLPMEQFNLVILPEFIFFPISTELPSIIYHSLVSIVGKLFLFFCSTCF